MENRSQGGSTRSERGSKGSAARFQSSPSTSNEQSSSGEDRRSRSEMVAAASSVASSATGDEDGDAQAYPGGSGATTTSRTRRLRSLPKHCTPKRSSSQVPTIGQKIGMSISSRTLASLPSLRWGDHAAHNSSILSAHHHFHFNEGNAAQLAADALKSDGKKRSIAVPRFNGVSAFRRRTKSGSGGGGNEVSNEQRRISRQIVRSSVEQLVSRNSNEIARAVDNGSHDEDQGSTQSEHRVAARSLLSNWLSLARTKIVKKENVKRQLQMSWYRSEIDTGQECCICLDEISAGSKVTQLPCKHIFHYTCIIEWVQKKKNCPQCRGDASSKAGPLPPPPPRRQSSPP